MSELDGDKVAFTYQVNQNNRSHGYGLIDTNNASIKFIHSYFFIFTIKYKKNII